MSDIYVVKVKYVMRKLFILVEFYEAEHLSASACVHYCLCMWRCSALVLVLLQVFSWRSKVYKLLMVWFNFFGRENGME